MIYNIPVSRVEELEKKINRIRNKGADITFNIIGDIWVENPNTDGVFYPCKEIEVEGSYKINGWVFVATIEHGGEEGNIVRIANPSLRERVPSQYWSAPRECEHCHLPRDRKDTYLIYNEETHDWKQVGRSCLKEYTGGLDAEACAQVASLIKECEDDSNVEHFASMGLGTPSIESSLVKRIAYELVKNEGYKKDGVTSGKLQDLIFNGHSEPAKASLAQIEEVDKWVEDLSVSSDYIMNAKTAWKKAYLEPRDLALVSSLIALYFRHKTEEARREAERAEQGLSNDYVGAEGDRITFEVKSARVLYEKYTRVNYYNSVMSNVWEIIDTEGHTYIWSTSNSDEIKAGNKITATIKGYKEFRGIKQTIITRGKIE